MVRTLADLDEYKKVVRAYDEARANVARLGPRNCRAVMPSR